MASNSSNIDLQKNINKINQNINNIHKDIYNIHQTIQFINKNMDRKYICFH